MLTDIKISHIVDEIVDEKGMNKETIIKSIIESIQSIYNKKYTDKEFNFIYNKKDDLFFIYEIKNVVSKVENEEKEISLKKAKILNEKININEKIEVPFIGKIGRIEISQIRQLITQKIKTLESEAIYKEFIEKKNSIINGIVTKVDSNGAYVNVYNYQAFLPNSFLIPGEKVFSNMPIRAIIKEVNLISKNNESVILERNSTEFIKKLLELEIPEIFEKIITIESIFRAPGYKTKIVVSSKDKNINPVGTVIGQRGQRIQSVLKEISGERLDLIEFTNDIEELIEKSLKPAKINSIEIRNGIAYIDLPEEDRAAAVGKGGKNIYLASKIIGMPIDILNNKKNSEKEDLKNEALNIFEEKEN